MKTYLFKFTTAYEEAAIIITTSKGLNYACQRAIELGAWHTNDVTVVETKTENSHHFVNYNNYQSEDKQP